MKTGNYTCELCKKEFEPTKRGIQRFCSRKCGQNHNYHKNKKAKINKINNPFNQVEAKNTKETTKIDQVSGAGVANGLIANVITEGAKYVIKKANETPNNTLATKKDLEEIKNQFGNRYRLIEKYKLGPNGEPHYFDLETNEIVYFPKRKENNVIKSQFNTANNVP